MFKKAIYKPPRHILITGASGGIGAVLAEYYATDGVVLYLSGRNAERLKDVAKRCGDKGAAVHAKIIDVTHQAEMLKWMSEADEKTPLDLVIANAGISGGSGGLHGAEPVQQAREIYNVNVKGVFNTIDPVFSAMMERRYGQIAIMSSLSAFSGWSGAPAYSSSKGAVRLYGEALRVDAARCNVRVNVICPGFIKTAMTDHNDFNMPFMMLAEEAAINIANGLARNKGRIVFPWPMYVMCGFIGMLPFVLVEKIMSRVPAKVKLIDS